MSEFNLLLEEVGDILVVVNETPFMEFSLDDILTEKQEQPQEDVNNGGLIRSAIAKIKQALEILKNRIGNFLNKLLLGKNYDRYVEMCNKLARDKRFNGRKFTVFDFYRVEGDLKRVKNETDNLLRRSHTMTQDQIDAELKRIGGGSIKKSAGGIAGKAVGAAVTVIGIDALARIGESNRLCSRLIQKYITDDQEKMSALEATAGKGGAKALKKHIESTSKTLSIYRFRSKIFGQKSNSLMEAFNEVRNDVFGAAQGKPTRIFGNLLGRATNSTLKQQTGKGLLRTKQDLDDVKKFGKGVVKDTKTIKNKILNK